MLARPHIKPSSAMRAVVERLQPLPPSLRVHCLLPRLCMYPLPPTGAPSCLEVPSMQLQDLLIDAGCHRTETSMAPAHEPPRGGPAMQVAVMQQLVSTASAQHCMCRLQTRGADCPCRFESCYPACHHSGSPILANSRAVFRVARPL